MDSNKFVVVKAAQLTKTSETHAWIDASDIGPAFNICDVGVLAVETKDAEFYCFQLVGKKRDSEGNIEELSYRFTNALGERFSLTVTT